MLCSKLVLHGEMYVNVNVFYFFSPFGPSLDNLASILRSLAAQIIRKNGDLADYVYYTYDRSEQLAPPEAVLRLVPELLQRVGNAHLVIDGIDAYDSIEQATLLQDLLTMLSTLSSSHICKVLVSSRDVPAISRCLPRINGRVTISLVDERDAIDQSITKFVDAKLSNLSVVWWKYQPDISAIKELIRTLLDRSDGKLFSNF